MLVSIDFGQDLQQTDRAGAPGDAAGQALDRRLVSVGIPGIDFQTLQLIGDPAQDLLALRIPAVLMARVNREILKVLEDVKRKFGPNVRKVTKLKYLRGWVVGRSLKEFLR